MRLPFAFVTSIALASSGCFGVAHHLVHAGTAVGLAVEAVAVGAGVVAAAARPLPPPTTVVVQPQVIVQPTAVIAQPAPAPALAPAPSPAPDSGYATWIPSSGKCTSRREFHVRCVRGAGGQSCFFETDDGEAFDCADAECNKAPDAINAWCQSTGGAPNAPAPAQ
jgi:hypothetical protein